MAILGPFHSTLVPDTVIKALTTFRGEHTFKSSTFSPPFDVYARNITAWLSDSISIGAESFNETVIGGPATSTSSFRPALIQWDTAGRNGKEGNGVGWIAWHATEPAMTAVAGPGTLNLIYPHGTGASIFTILVSPFKAKKNVKTWADILGLTVKISGTVDSTYALSYAGGYGGADSPINDFEFWNFTYSMPVGSKAKPSLIFEVELE
jgi:hypothetical protein